MPSTETNELRCGGCGAPIPRDAPFGQCPRCVLALGRGILLVPEPDGDLLNAGQVRSFGDYELLEELARGGMGVVYRARQLSLRREVAVKMILAGALATTDAVQRFRNEAAAAARLDHPHIVSVYEIGEHETQHFFSMRLVLGRQNIATWVRALTLPPAERAARIVALMVKVARAVDYAHEHGVLHRDLKPSNILVDEKGEPQVVDFGIARPLGVDSDFTLTGQMVGTPRYMAPEQARGENRTLTPAADTYSLGAILYELLADRKIFNGTDMLTLLRQVTEQPPTPLAIGVHDLESIVMRCVEKSPAARYGSAGNFADDLERWLRREPVTARPAGPVARLAQWARRRPASAALAAAAVAGAVALTTFLLSGTGKKAMPAAPVAPGPAIVDADPAATRRAVEWLHRSNGRLGFVTLQATDGARFRVVSGKPLPSGEFKVIELSFDYWPNPKNYPPIAPADFRMHTAALHHLQTCILAYLDLKPADFAFLAHNPDLTELRIATFGSDAILAHAAGLTKLRTLRIADKWANGDIFTGRDLHALASLPVLETVAFRQTHIDDAIVALLADRCARLQVLSLDETPITDAALRSLSRRSLQDLNLGGNPALTDAGLAELAKIPALKKLNLKGSTGFTAAGVAAFQKAHPECAIERWRRSLRGEGFLAAACKERAGKGENMVKNSFSLHVFAAHRRGERGQNTKPKYDKMKTYLLKLCGCLLLAAAASLGSAFGATIPVTNTNDSGPGSLRQAIATAVAGDTVDASALNGTITLTSGELVVAKNLAIVGPGANLLTISGAGGGVSRVFLVGSPLIALPPTPIVAISGLTMTGGNGIGFSADRGGALLNFGTLSLSRCVLSGNSAKYHGGAIYNAGALTLSECAVSFNTAGADAGGIYNFNNATLGIAHSTVSGNTGGVGGILTFGRLDIINSTVSGNTGSFGGGGIYFYAPGTGSVSHCTITNNYGRTYGGGLFAFPAPVVTVDHTIIAQNFTSLSTDGDAGGTFTPTFTSGGYNLIGKTDGSLGWVATDLKGTVAVPLDPKLGTLADNGGLTFTHNLLAGSPAINAGDPAFNPNSFSPPLTTDQRGRGFSRVSKGRVDIGAVEFRKGKDDRDDRDHDHRGDRFDD